MNNKEDYASDSDQSDEDFCPYKASNNLDALSEEESDDPISDNEEEPVTKKKPSTKKKSTKKQTKTAEPAPESDRVVATRNRGEIEAKFSLEKDELDSDEEDPNRKNALWADFLSDVAPVVTKPAGPSRKSIPDEKQVPVPEKTRVDPPKEPKKIVVTEIFDFAGEEVRVEKTISADSLKENAATKKPEAGRSSVKRPGGTAGGGLGSILGQLGKKKKISVLEKTKLDWDTFKTNEGIEEELQTHNKGKDGYLQRQDFLERTDLRQFEIEKSIRASRRKPL